MIKEIELMKDKVNDENKPFDGKINAVFPNL